jgi:hypothetical protein
MFIVPNKKILKSSVLVFAWIGPEGSGRMSQEGFSVKRVDNPGYYQLDVHTTHVLVLQ